MAAAPARHAEWTFYRDESRVVLLKGAIDEVWTRDEAGRIRLERIFHEEQRVVDYSAGELATLGVQVDWAGLTGFVDQRTLAALRVVGRSGSGASERIRLAGKVGQARIQCEWLPALQLPARFSRTEADGRMAEFRLLQHASSAPAAWLHADARSAAYLRLDAADFGDMGYEPVVRKSEALDARLGWRAAHAHD